jgi:hypothetical protein
MTKLTRSCTTGSPGAYRNTTRSKVTDAGGLPGSGSVAGSSDGSTGRASASRMRATAAVPTWYCVTAPASWFTGAMRKKT